MSQMAKRSSKKTLKLAEVEAVKTYDDLYEALSRESPGEDETSAILSFIAELKVKRDQFITSSRAFEGSLERAGHKQRYHEQFLKRRVMLEDCFGRIATLNKQMERLGGDMVSNLDPKDLSSLRSERMSKLTSVRREKVGPFSTPLSVASEVSTISEGEDEEYQEQESNLDDLAGLMEHASVSSRRSILEPRVEANHRLRAPRQGSTLDAASVHLIRAELLKTPANPFKGDIGLYHCWESDLKNRLQGLALGPIEELQVLAANTAGKPKEYVQRTMRSVIGNNAEAVLQVVWNTLRERYGSDWLLAEHTADQLRNFPNIPPGDLTALQDFLDSTSTALTNAARSDELEEFCTTRGMRLLALKLPPDLQRRWHRKASDLRAKSGQRPTFSFFNQFLRDEERAMRDPFFNPALSGGRPKPVRVLHTSADQNTKKESSEGDQSMVAYNKPESRYEAQGPHNKKPPETDHRINKCIFHKVDAHGTWECRSFGRLPIDQKKKLITEAKVCFRCLGPHYIRNCDKQVKCSHCQGSHLTVMHRASTKPVTPGEVATCTRTGCLGLESREFSKTLLVDVTSTSTQRKVRCYAIIDEQSSRCFADPSLIEQLDLKATPWKYALRTLSGLSSEVEGHAITGLKIRGVGENRWHQLPTTWTNENIPDTTDEVATPDVVKKLSHVAHLVKHFNEHDPLARSLILIGRDAVSLMASRHYGVRGPLACKTALGWALLGPLNGGARTQQTTALRTSFVNHEDHHFSIKIRGPNPGRQTLDVFEERVDDELQGLSVLDNKFVSILRAGIEVKDDRIVAPLPFTRDPPNLCNNYVSVLGRTNTTLGKLRRDPSSATLSLEKMQSYIDNDHVEEVVAGELPEKGVGWYLPIFPVRQAQEGKVRLVFDGSAKHKGHCLNDELLTGPDLNNSLRGILQRFRLHQVAFTIDIKNMFHNFRVKIEDRDYLRFFWFKDNRVTNEIVPYRAKVHVFGLRSSPAVAAFALRHIADLGDASGRPSRATDFLRHATYVDDGSASLDSPDEARELLGEVRSLLHKYGLNIHKVATSDTRVTVGLPDEELAAPKTVTWDGSVIQRTLGIHWNVSEDLLIFKVNIPDRPFTRRGVLSTVNSFFDPLGLAAPLILGGRLLQRKALSDSTAETNQSSTLWDEPLPKKLEEHWESWKDGLRRSKEIRLSRCVKPRDFGEVSRHSLHVFCDASQEAIGYAIYLRLTSTREQKHSTLINASSRVAPRAATTIPRLELCAAVEAVLAARETLNDLKVNVQEVRYYTDSQIVLGYLKNEDKRFTRYVTRRIELINKHCSPTQWYFVDTKENPADMATRPTDVEQLVHSHWFTGPAWILEDCVVDAQPPFEEAQLTESLPETKAFTTLTGSPPPFRTVMDRLSRWTRLLGVTRTVHNLAHKWLMRARSNLNTSSEPTLRILQNDQEAEMYLVKAVQQESYSEILPKTGKPGPMQLPEGHQLTPLAPFVDEEGLIRVGGRLKHSDLPVDQKHPLILPRNHPFTQIIIRRAHQLVAHQGRLLTLGKVRSLGFFIPQGRKQIERLLRSCVICRRLRAPFEQQMMADLPEDRLIPTPPFTRVGLDVFGPFTVHDGQSTRITKATKKMYGLLVTCLVSRAVHVEPLCGMDTPSFMNALRRFISVRGTPQLIRSDRGTNFTGAVSQSCDLNKVSKDMETRGCEWKFNLPGASHHGGVWERKIGAIRKVLDLTLGRSGKVTLNRDDMHTLLIEAAAIVNSTPLYAPSEDPNDVFPISPSTLLTMRDASRTQSSDSFTDRDLLAYGPRRWRRVQLLADQFWQLWRQFYLQEISRRRKWTTPRRPLSQGDIVLVRDSQSPRCQWPLARVESVHRSGSDGRVRGATLRRTDNSGGTKSCERSIKDIVVILPSTVEREECAAFAAI